MTVVVPSNENRPSPLKWPVAVMLFVVCEVALPLPDILPLKGIDGVAEAAGNALRIARTLRIAGIKIGFFILVQTPRFLFGVSS